MIFTLSEISLKEGIEEVTEDDIENIRRIKARLDEIGIRREFIDLNIYI